MTKEKYAMHYQRTINFDVPVEAAEPEHVAAATSLPPPPLVRPHRQIVYPDATTHYDWPPAAELHDRDTITVDRITDDIDGPAHRFVIKRGDKVEAYMGHNRFHAGEVIGVSHARQEVRVAWDETLKKGGWFKVGAIYPAAEAESQPAKPQERLSALVEKVNAEHAPPDGWEEQEQLPEPITFDGFMTAYQALREGSLTLGEYHAAFERVVASQESVQAELLARFKAKPLAVLAARFGDYRAKSNSKTENAKGICRQMLSAFLLDGTVSFAMGESYAEAVKTKVRAVTEDAWHAHFAAVAEKQADRERALDNPENLADFRRFIDAKGRDALTDEQFAQWDRLHAEVTRENRAAAKPTAVTQFASDELSETTFTVKEGYHDKRQCPVWIVQFTERVERSTFNELNQKAKMLGGWYSSFKKADAGFQFLSTDTAERFTELLAGDVDRSDVLAGRKERRELTASERLHELADEMLKRSEETIDGSLAALQNTARRADIQAGVRGRAYAEAALARSMHSVAEALSRGEAKFLDGVRHRTHLETLDMTLRLARWARLRTIQKARNESDYGFGLNYQAEQERPLGEQDVRFAEYPYPTVHLRAVLDMIRACEGKTGLKLRSARLTKRLPKTEDYCTFRREADIELLGDYVARAKATRYDAERLEAALADYNRLRRANIHTEHELRSALREYLPHRSAARGDDPVLVAERELIGKELPGFFPTPRTVIDELFTHAGIQPGHRVLEPSCGKGDILDALAEEHAGAEVTAIELNRTLADVLAAKGHAVEFGDFLSHQGAYDRIVMNPPFERGADIEHVRHAYELLAPGGRVVSVMSEGPFYRSDSHAVAFREWIDEHGGLSQPLPDGSFTGRDAFRQTGVATRLVVIDKPAQT